jgi:N-acyl-D-amino-acid deacylase
MRTLFLLLALSATAQAQTAALDQAMRTLLQRYDVPGGALAVTFQNRLVYARGFGLKDKLHNEPFQADTPARVGSVSKPITAIAVLRLADQGRLRLDDRILDLLGESVAPRSLIADSRWNQITVRHLLQHSGGWDPAQTYDPLFLPADVYRELLPKLPPDPRDLLRVMLTEPLQFAPGTRYAYSNFGYLVLGLLMERVVGKPYDQAVQELVLNPAGIVRARIGAVPVSGRWLGEANYYLPTDTPLVDSVYEPGTKVAPPDGALWGEHIQAAGGWTISAIDLARLFLAIDGRRGPALLSRTMLSELTSRPAYARPNDISYYGLGLQIEPANGGFNFSHDGYIGGTLANVYRAERNGLGVFVVVNGTPEEEAKLAGLFEALLITLPSVASSITDWGTTNLWSPTPSTQPRIAEDGVVNAANGLITPIVAGGYYAILGDHLTGARIVVNGLTITPQFTSATQINFQVPLVITGTTAQITVERSGTPSNTITLPIAEASPALFSLSGNGRGIAITQRRPGFITVFANSLGTSSPTQLRATIGGTTVPIESVDGLAVTLRAQPGLSLAQPIELRFANQPSRKDLLLP